MFAFFHKILTPKAGGEIRHLSWGDPEEWLAFGGGKGTLTLLNTQAILAEDTPCLRVVKGAQQEGSEFLNLQTLTYAGKANVSVPDTAHLTTASNGYLETRLDHIWVTLQVISWNSVENRLTSLDESGCFAVWKRENKVWVNELVNTNAWKGVRDCAASPDGKKICFLCSDGRLYVCTKDGQKLWSKELKRQMRHVLWSPTGLELFLCSEAGEVFFYDSEGFYTHSYHAHQSRTDQQDTCAALVPVADVDWYPGERRLSVDPALAIAYEDGCLEISVGDTGNEPLTFDAHLVKCIAVAWRPTGEVLAVLGNSPLIHPLVPANREGNGNRDSLIRFFSITGNLLHTLVLPEGKRARTFTWNKTGNTIVVASSDALFFAKVQTKSIAAYFERTVVYTTPASEGSKYLLWFWNTDRHSKHLRVVDKVLHIQTAAGKCLVATETQSCERHHRLATANARYALTIYSSTGDVRRKFASDSTPEHIAFTESHIIAAYAQTLRLWAYTLLPTEKRTRKEDRTCLSSGDLGDLRECYTSVSSGKQTYQRMRSAPCALSGTVPPPFSPAGMGDDTYSKMLTLSEPGEGNSIVGLTANARCFIVASRYGEIRSYSLPAIELEYKCTLKSPPLTVQINNDGSRLAVVDVLHVLRLYDSFRPKRSRTRAQERCELDIVYEREDVSHVLWASDSPGSFALSQKNVFYVVQGTALEEVVQCSASLLEYTGLCLRGVYFDKLMRLPSSPNTSYLYEFRTKALRDTEAMLQNPLNLRDGLCYIEQKSHPILWSLLATAALAALSFRTAEEAYIRCQDYFGLLFLKYLSSLDSREKQMAEVYAYFGKVYRAEQLYMSTGRMDLAFASRSSAGDWSRVLEMCREHKWGAEVTQNALKELADSHKDNGCWSEAIEIYTQMQKKTLLARALYVTEQYEALYNLVAYTAEGEGLLVYIGQRLASVGMCDEAITAFRKAGYLELADDVCIRFNEWALAKRLLYGKHVQRDSRMPAYVEEHPLQQNRIIHAIQVQERESSPKEAVKALIQRTLASKSDALRSDPVKAKMMYVLAALLAEMFTNDEAKLQGRLFRCTFQGCPLSATHYSPRRLHRVGINPCVQAQSLPREVQESKDYNYGEAAEACWKGAEAFHLYILYHQHMSKKRFNDAVCAAARLTEYSEYINTHVAYEMLALASYHAQSWHACSIALMRLESVPCTPLQHQATIANFAVNVFIHHSPVVPASDNPSAPVCPTCHARLESWDLVCHHCGVSFSFCIGSGRPVFASQMTSSVYASFHAWEKPEASRLRLWDMDSDLLTCCTCRRKTFATAARTLENCRLCHRPFTVFSASAPVYHTYSEYLASAGNQQKERLRPNGKCDKLGK